MRSPVSGYDSEEFDEEDPFDEMEREFSSAKLTFSSVAYCLFILLCFSFYHTFGAPLYSSNACTAVLL